MPAVGEIAPDFELLNDEGKPVRLSDFRGKKVILYFYPEDFTSGCELQACKFRDAYSQIEAKNSLVLGISPDGVDSHRRFREAHSLPFHLLVDEDLEVSKAWNSLKVDESGSPTGTRRGQYVIDEQGRIIDAQTPVKAAESIDLALAKLGAI